MSDTVRLLVCADCLSLEILPAWDWDSARDDALEAAWSRHQTAGALHMAEIITGPRQTAEDPAFRAEMIRGLEAARRTRHYA
jgi:hypothetical protein